MRKNPHGGWGGTIQWRRRKQHRCVNWGKSHNCHSGRKEWNNRCSREIREMRISISAVVRWLQVKSSSVWCDTRISEDNSCFLWKLPMKNTVLSLDFSSPRSIRAIEEKGKHEKSFSSSYWEWVKNQNKCVFLHSGISMGSQQMLESAFGVFGGFRGWISSRASVLGFLFPAQSLGRELNCRGLTETPHSRIQPYHAYYYCYIIIKGRKIVIFKKCRLLR